jgi:C1A family cysteine protease
METKKFYPSLLKGAKSAALIIIVITLICPALRADPPRKFDLRDYNGNNYVTGVRSQAGGTCWTFGAYAGPEGWLLMSNGWAGNGEVNEPNLAEYHLDWWNGFNNFFNADADDPWNPSGVPVHNGGNYHMTSAYLSRGEGAVRELDAPGTSDPSDRFNINYHYYYVKEIEWYNIGDSLSNIDLLKTKIMTQGPMATCLTYDPSFLSPQLTHYQPPDNPMDLNHAVAIVGWDDDKATQAPLPGAWLVKNSWGSDWGFDGYFWISYYDKFCGREPDLGAVSFYDAVPLKYPHVYYYDYHGWTDTKSQWNEAFNAYVCEQEEVLTAVNFVTGVDSVNFEFIIFDDFQDGQLSGVIASGSGFRGHKGFHTEDLDSQIVMQPGNDFYVYLQLSNGGQPCDRTMRSLKTTAGTFRGPVVSKAEPGQSYYRDDTGWHDLYESDNTANFCIKAISCTFTIIENPPTLGHKYTPYEYRFRAVGGEKPYHWRRLSGQVPYGCAFTGDTIGMISGTPNWPGIFTVTVELQDSDDPPMMDTIIYQFVIGDPLPVCGDANGDLDITIADAVYLINYIFMNGSAPDPMGTAEVNCDSRVTLVDAVYLINYIFKSGNSPCDPSGDGFPDCAIVK